MTISMYMTPIRKEKAKKRFMLTSKKLIECDNQILDIIKTVLEVMQKFDGKVINKRLLDAINEAIETNHPVYDNTRVTAYYVSFSTAYSNNNVKISTYMLKRWIPEIKADCASKDYYLPIPETGNRLNMLSDFQINAIQSIQNNIHDHIKDLNRCMDNFDVFWDRASKIEKAINEFNDWESTDGCPFTLRNAPGFVQFKTDINYL